MKKNLLFILMGLVIGLNSVQGAWWESSDEAFGTYSYSEEKHLRHQAYCDGFYAGIHGGCDFVGASRMEASKVPSIDPVAFTLDAKSQSIGLSLGGHVGYLMTCGRFVFGPEVIGEYKNNENQNSNQFFDYVYKTRQLWSVGGKFRAGYLITPATWLYGLVGGKVTRVKHSVLERATGVSTSVHGYVPAIMYGVGIEQDFDGRHRIRLEVVQSAYQTKHFLVNQKAGTPAVHDSHYSPKSTEILIGYSYAF